MNNQRMQIREVSQRLWICSYRLFMVILSLIGMLTMRCRHDGVFHNWFFIMLLAAMAESKRMA